MSEWKIKRGESEFTAPDIDTLRRWAAEARVVPDDYVLNPVLGNWVYAKDLLEIQDLMQSLGTKCPHCGKFGVKQVEGLQGSENIFGCILVAFLFIPAVIYYWDKTRYPYCTACGKRVPPGSGRRPPRKRSAPPLPTDRSERLDSRVRQLMSAIKVMKRLASIRPFIVALIAALMAFATVLWLWSTSLANRRSQEIETIILEQQARGPCGVERVKTSLKAMDSLRQRWSEEESIASSTPRIALAGRVSELQKIRRDLMALDVAPCLTVARNYRSEEMNEILSGYLAFMANSTRLEYVARRLDAAAAGLESDRRILAIRERLFPEDISKEMHAAEEADRLRRSREAEVVKAEQDEQEERIRAEREEQAGLQQQEEERKLIVAEQEERVAKAKEERIRRMEGWSLEYSTQIRPVKAALNDVLAASDPSADIDTLEQACSRLQRAVAQLEVSPARRVPDVVANLHFNKVLTGFHKIQYACKYKSGESIKAAVAELERALRGFAAALQPYMLSP